MKTTENNTEPNDEKSLGSTSCSASREFPKYFVHGVDELGPNGEHISHPVTLKAIIPALMDKLLDNDDAAKEFGQLLKKYDITVDLIQK